MPKAYLNITQIKEIRIGASRFEQYELAWRAYNHILRILRVQLTHSFSVKHSRENEYNNHKKELNLSR